MCKWLVKTMSLLSLVPSTRSTLAILLTFCASTAQAQTWPRIAPARVEFRFSGGAAEPALALELFDREATPVYRLVCHTSHFEADREFSYSGDWECRLVPLNDKTPFSTLLTDDPKQSRDWQSRARFLVPELLGACGEWPDYGRVRSFSLRGMRLTLTVSGVEVAPNPAGAPERSSKLSAFQFTVDVTPDLMATSAIAAPSKAVWPPVECGQGYRSPH
jgi:hypothetical protein